MIELDNFGGYRKARVLFECAEIEILTLRQVEVIRDARLTRARIDRLLVPDDRRA